jgi:hypothetical protein
MRELLKELKPKFDEVDPKQISLDLYIEELETLEQDSKNLNRKVNPGRVKVDGCLIALISRQIIRSKTAIL